MRRNVNFYSISEGRVIDYKYHQYMIFTIADFLVAMDEIAVLEFNVL